MDLRTSFATQGYAQARNAAAPQVNSGQSAGDLAKDFATDFAKTVAAGEETAKAAMSGGADPHSLVEALAASELAVEGKQVATDAIASLGKVVGDTASQIDEKLGEQYGDYARKASRTLQETSAKLESKSVDELSEDARAMVRKSPGVAVGIAAVVGFFLARMLGGKKR